MHARYTAARNTLGDEMYQELRLMVRKFDETGVVGVDLQNVTFPAMRAYFQRAQAYDDAITAIYGKRYTLLNADLIDWLERAIDEYDAALTNGRSTTDAQESLGGAVQAVDSLLLKRFTENNILLPAK